MGNCSIRPMSAKIMTELEGRCFSLAGIESILNKGTVAIVTIVVSLRCVLCMENEQVVLLLAENSMLAQIMHLHPVQSLLLVLEHRHSGVATIGRVTVCAVFTVMSCLSIRFYR